MAGSGHRSAMFLPVLLSELDRRSQQRLRDFPRRRSSAALFLKRSKPISPNSTAQRELRPTGEEQRNCFLFSVGRGSVEPTKVSA
jgi:hypothetical protein